MNGNVLLTIIFICQKIESGTAPTKKACRDPNQKGLTEDRGALSIGYVRWPQVLSSRLISGPFWNPQA
jgi:hypothetical protein